MFFILTENLTIDKKEYINEFLKKYESENSELTFTNLFMWRKSFNVEYAVISDMLVIISHHKGAPYYVYFPIGNGDYKEALDEIMKHFDEKNEKFLLRISDETEIKKLNEAYPNLFEIKEDIDSNDYVYNVSDLETLKGKKYHSKRNFINRFKNKYKFTYEKMTPDMKDECMTLFKKWYDERKDEIKGVEEHLEAVGELLNNWERLDIKGGCIKVDGKMIAFSFGEALTSETAVIHLEHADTSYDGAYPMMNNAFIENEWKSFLYVNREEDMGLEGLRKAKQSYYPCRMVRKYTAKLK